MKHRAKSGSLLTGTEWEAATTHLESVTTVAATGSTETLSPGFYDLTLDQLCTFSLSGATDDEAGVITAILRGAFATTWPAEVTWLNGAPPAVALRVVTLFSVDGTNWLGTSSRVTGPVRDEERYTGGAITVNSAVAGNDLANVSDLSLAASAGDLLLIGVSIHEEGTAPSVSIRFDVATVVSGSAVNYLSSLSGTPASTGVAAWFGHASTPLSIGGQQQYIVQSGDLSGGNVTLRLCSWVSSSSRDISASSDAPLVFSAVNLGQ